MGLEGVGQRPVSPPVKSLVAPEPLKGNIHLGCSGSHLCAGEQQLGTLQSLQPQRRRVGHQEVPPLPHTPERDRTHANYKTRS